jgi:uncharacterized protein YndB with AHSA1/START domain
VDRLNQWWGPKGCSIEVVSLDLRPGGMMHYRMGLPGGGAMWGRFIYREISAPERLEFVVSFSDEAGGVTRAPFSAEWPLETLSTMTLTEVEGSTLMEMTGVPINATDAERKTFAAGTASMQQGWGATLDQLQACLATDGGKN